MITLQSLKLYLISKQFFVYVYILQDILVKSGAIVGETFPPNFKTLAFRNGIAGNEGFVQALVNIRV